jgi:hypothetical protein
MNKMKSIIIPIRFSIKQPGLLFLAPFIDRPPTKKPEQHIDATLLEIGMKVEYYYTAP